MFNAATITALSTAVVAIIGAITAAITAYKAHGKATQAQQGTTAIAAALQDHKENHQ